jgi:hypothetical protein
MNVENAVFENAAPSIRAESRGIVIDSKAEPDYADDSIRLTRK